MYIPTFKNLPISHLAATFQRSRVTNSYKYYWFLAILQCLEKRHFKTQVLDIQDIIIQMLANVWYPIHFYRLSFGKQDKLANAVLAIKNLSHGTLQADSKQSEIVAFLETKTNDKAFQREISFFNKYVPYRFLSTWFSEELKGQKDRSPAREIALASLANLHFADSEKMSFYRFLNENKSIEIHEVWLEYIVKNFAILEGFCFWHLIQYLQKNNPNVPNIADKLFAPQIRKLSKATKFWKDYLNDKKQVSCIYSAQIISLQDLSIDHFLPWSFVAHDQLWNLIPTTKAVNSSKNNSLPKLDIYFDAFAKLQFEAFLWHFEKGKPKVLEDYSLLFRKEESDIARLSPRQFQQHLSEHISPLMQIASNLGFTQNWTYKL